MPKQEVAVKKPQKAKVKVARKGPHPMALARIRKYFKNVERVEEAKDPMPIEVREDDTRLGTALNEAHCALARACGRNPGVIGALIGISYSYLIYRDKAVRYYTGSAIAREIVSFDRHHDFSPGKYRLAVVSPKNRLGMKTGGNDSKHIRTGRLEPKRVIHFTDRVRRVGKG